MSGQADVPDIARGALGTARSTLGLPAISYTDPSPSAGVTPIRAAHIMELRAGTQ